MTNATRNTQSATNDEGIEQIRRIYERYGPDLLAFLSDVQRQLKLERSVEPPARPRRVSKQRA